jgi:hypothetical protein
MDRIFSILFVFFSMTSLAGAGDVPAIDRARKELEPRLVKLVHDAIPLSEALKSLQEQTGNEIANRRRLHQENPKLTLDLKAATFWEALDKITGLAGCGYSVHEEDGKVALVDTPQRTLNVTYLGICRLAVKRVRADRDEASGHHYCTVLAELTWEPRFRPLYVNVGAAEAVLADGREGDKGQGTKDIEKAKQKIAAPGQITVEGRGAIEFELRLDPAPPRSCPSLESLAGQLKLIGPAKMLTLRLPAQGLQAKKPVEQVQDDVKVVFKPYAPQSSRWTFDVSIFNPPGAYSFDSYQQHHWLIHNKLFLEKLDGGKTAPLRTSEEEFVQGPDFKQTTIRYSFTGRLPEKTAGWSLVYQTPGRIVDLPLTYGLKNIRLP